MPRNDTSNRRNGTVSVANQGEVDVAQFREEDDPGDTILRPDDFKADQTLNGPVRAARLGAMKSFGHIQAGAFEDDDRITMRAFIRLGARSLIPGRRDVVVAPAEQVTETRFIRGSEAHVAVEGGRPEPGAPVDVMIGCSKCADDRKARALRHLARNLNRG